MHDSTSRGADLRIPGLVLDRPVNGLGIAERQPDRTTVRQASLARHPPANPRGRGTNETVEGVRAEASSNPALDPALHTAWPKWREGGVVELAHGARFGNALGVVVDTVDQVLRSCPDDVLDPPARAPGWTKRPRVVRRASEWVISGARYQSRLDGVGVDVAHEIPAVGEGADRLGQESSSDQRAIAPMAAIEMARGIRLRAPQRLRELAGEAANEQVEVGRQQAPGVQLEASAPDFEGQPGEEITDVVAVLEERTASDGAVDDVVPGAGEVLTGAARHRLLTLWRVRSRSRFFGSAPESLRSAGCQRASEQSATTPTLGGDAAGEVGREARAR